MRTIVLLYTITTHKINRLHLIRYKTTIRFKYYNSNVHDLFQNCSWKRVNLSFICVHDKRVSLATLIFIYILLQISESVIYLGRILYAFFKRTVYNIHAVAMAFPVNCQRPKYNVSLY